MAVVALVGRPNVGKSALFNRLVGRRLSIVDDVPGTTRDRLYGRVEWRGRDFILIDTGGLDLSYSAQGSLAPGSSTYMEAIHNQVQEAVAQADLLILVVDASEGVTAADEAVAEMLRRSGKPIVVAANKADSLRLRQDVVDFYRLGLGEPLPISALHGSGTGDLLDEVVRHLPAAEEPQKTPEQDASLRIAIVGRPNVGKSSLLNALLGEERVIVSEVPGTTRDAIDTQLEYANRRITLIDTAGIRRRGRIVPGVEQYSVLRAMQAIERCDVALLVLDASQPVASQDTHIAGYVLDAGKSIVLVANKWDLVSSAAAQQEWLAEVRDAFKFASYAPVACVSAKTGYGLDGMMEHVFTVASARQKRISDAELSQMVRQALLRVNPPSKGGQRLRIFSFRQVGVAPPRFLALVNEPKLAHFSFTRYLENQVRALYPFPGTPLQIEYARKQDSNRR